MNKCDYQKSQYCSNPNCESYVANKETINGCCSEGCAEEAKEFSAPDDRHPNTVSHC